MGSNTILELEVKGGGKLAFRSADDALAWLTSELDAWSWLRKAPVGRPANVSVASFRFRDAMFRSLEQAKAHFQNYKVNPGDQTALDAATSNTTIYANTGLVSSTAVAKFINQLRSKPEGDVVASSALATYQGEDPLPAGHGQAQDAQYRFPALVGRIAMAGFPLGFSKNTTNSIAASVEDIAQNNRRILEEERASNQAALSALNASVEQIVSQQKAWNEKKTEELHAELDEFDEKKNQIIKDCEDAHARYHKWMETAAGNAYWTEEHVARKKSSVLWGRVLGGYTLAAAVILILILYFSYRYAVSENAPVYAQTHLVVSGAVVLAVTILFWIARFLTRMYLSERHMAIDANLRSVMVKTYLALSTDEKLREQDRALVLAPLFRAGTDGIIKEDTGMDSVLSLVARALEKPAKS